MCVHQAIFFQIHYTQLTGTTDYYLSFFAFFRNCFNSTQTIELNGTFELSD
ncbi:hypothetical protein D3C80_1962200 [compost metagenome]